MVLFSVYGCVTFRHNWNFHSTSPFHCFWKFLVFVIIAKNKKLQNVNTYLISNLAFVRFRVRHCHFLGHNFYFEQCSTFSFSVRHERFGFNLFSGFTGSGAIFCYSQTLCAFKTSEEISDVESHSRNMDSGGHFECWRVRC